MILFWRGMAIFWAVFLGYDAASGDWSMVAFDALLLVGALAVLYALVKREARA